MRDNTRTLLPEDMRRAAEHRAARGIPRDTNAELIGHTSYGAEVWHTDLVDRSIHPEWPPGPHRPVLYRGVATRTLPLVFTTGSDVPAHAAFFATPYRDKAWEYPFTRKIAAMLVIDRALTERSYIAIPGDDSTQSPARIVDKTRYPNSYIERHANGNVSTVHTRFTDRLAHSFYDESIYGHWIPGDARDALLGVILGGPSSAIADLCTQLPITPTAKHG